MIETIKVDGSTLRIELVPSSDTAKAHLVIHSTDHDQSLIVFMHEAPALREALVLASTQLAKLEVRARRRREHSNH